ncbi:MAG: DUF2141 domain-containing protein [Mucispirillum sp.]|nr:DUF2141 domain-containing protein [Mucispirillum sp.]
MKKIIFTYLFLFLVFNLYAQTVPFTFSIENIGSDKGSILVSICSNADEFAEREPCKYSFSIPAKKGTITQQINIDKGMYSIIVYHDENSNNMLDMAMFGKPIERYGFSNNKYGAFGSKPPFSEALINIDGQTSAAIKLRK